MYSTHVTALALASPKESCALTARYAARTSRANPKLGRSRSPTMFTNVRRLSALASKEMGSSAEDRVLRRRKTDRESCLRLKFSIYNARPSKVLTTERLVFFRDYYEIESGQGNDAASVPRSRQAQRQAVESPHDREASSFSGTITRSRAGKATILLLFQEADRQNARPSKVLTTERLVDRFQGRLRDRERARQRYCFLVDRQNARQSKVLTTERLVFFRDH